jgi:hypothetical protein
MLALLIRGFSPNWHFFSDFLYIYQPSRPLMRVNEPKKTCLRNVAASRKFNFHPEMDPVDKTIA